MTNPYYYQGPAKHPLIIEFMIDEHGKMREYEIFGKTVFLQQTRSADTVSYKYEDGNLEVRLTVIVVPTTKTDAELQYVAAVNFWGHGETISNRKHSIDAAVKDLQQIVTHRYRFMQPFMSK